MTHVVPPTALVIKGAAAAVALVVVTIWRAERESGVLRLESVTHVARKPVNHKPEVVGLVLHSEGERAVIAYREDTQVLFRYLGFNNKTSHTHTQFKPTEGSAKLLKPHLKVRYSALNLPRAMSRMRKRTW